MTRYQAVTLFTHCNPYWQQICAIIFLVSALEAEIILSYGLFSSSWSECGQADSEVKPTLILGDKIFLQKCSKILFVKKISQITHVGKRKVWHGDTLAKLIYLTKQRNAKFTKIFHCHNNRYTVALPLILIVLLLCYSHLLSTHNRYLVRSVNYCHIAA